MWPTGCHERNVHINFNDFCGIIVCGKIRVYGRNVMNPVFIEILNKEFISQHTIEVVNEIEFIVFSANSFDFGDVDIFEEKLGQYIVTLGRFTHTHFNISDIVNDENIQQIAIEITNFLMRVFENDIVCYGSHKGCGGYVDLKEMDKFDEKTLEEEKELFVWSGKYK